MKNIIFISPPAAGKGTFSKLINQEYNIPHISTGDLLREEASKDSELGLSIKKLIDNGEFVSDEIITKLLKNRLSMDDCNNGYILDGYPRNIKQAKIYEELLKELNKSLGIVIFLDIDKQLAKQRALSRIVCSTCGTSYNLLKEELRPKVENICDKCNLVLNTRKDDNAETFDQRFDTYMEKTSDLINYYKELGNLIEIKIIPEESAMETYKRIKEYLND